MTQWELLNQCIGMGQDVSTQLHSEAAEPYVAHASLVELSVVGDTVGTTQLHNQCIGIGQDVSMQLCSEVAEPYVAHASLVELHVVGDTVGTTQLHI